MTRNRCFAFVTLLLALMLAGRPLAMSATNYRLDWFTPLIGGGGDRAVSLTTQSTSSSVNQPLARPPARTVKVAWATGVAQNLVIGFTCRSY